MTQLWYNMDEVADYHPIVEATLNRAILDLGLSGLYEVKHHPPIPGSSIVPDFVVYLRNTSNPVFVVEVKRTKRDCNSERFWRQTRDYVNAFSSFWGNTGFKYYAITNCEQLITFCEREGPVWGCVLSENPYTDISFQPLGPNNAVSSINGLYESFKRIMSSVHNSDEPKWSETWPLIIRYFDAHYNNLKDYLHGNIDDIRLRDLVSYELLRILLYNYLKTYYENVNGSMTSAFRNMPEEMRSTADFKLQLNNIYERILLIDFEQIFQDHPDTINRLFPEKEDAVVFHYLSEFIRDVKRNIEDAFNENPSVTYFINLLKQNVYEHEEMHKEGKISTDYELASLLAELCISDPNAMILDIGTGTGVLSEAAYDRINLLSMRDLLNKSHNELLSQLSN